MNLAVWIDKRVHIILRDGFIYVGDVLDSDSNSISLRDKNGHLVQLREENISQIKELENFK